MPTLYNFVDWKTIYKDYNQTRTLNEFVIRMEKYGYTRLLATDIWKLIDHVVDQEGILHVGD